MRVEADYMQFREIHRQRAREYHNPDSDRSCHLVHQLRRLVLSQVLGRSRCRLLPFIVLWGLCYHVILAGYIISFLLSPE